MYDEKILLQQALAGEQHAYTKLVQQYEHLVFTLALRMVKHREEALEVSQDAFLKAFRYLGDFRGECKFSSWLYKIAYSVAINYLRKKRPYLLSLEDEKMTFSLTSSERIDEKVEQSDRKNSLETAIRQLSADDAAIITLFYIFEQKIDEICIAMELTETNAKTKLSRARQRLRTIIERDFPELK
jgi:RNA polymerase sigma factor (sigma-70 family)